MQTSGNRITLRFAQPGGEGMAARKSPGKSREAAEPVGHLDGLEGFAIAGADRKWHWAEAVIEGQQVVVWLDRVERSATDFRPTRAGRICITGRGFQRPYIMPTIGSFCSITTTR